MIFPVWSGSCTSLRKEMDCVRMHHWSADTVWRMSCIKTVYEQQGLQHGAMTRSKFVFVAKEKGNTHECLYMCVVIAGETFETHFQNGFGSHFQSSLSCPINSKRMLERNHIRCHGWKVFSWCPRGALPRRPSEFHCVFGCSVRDTLAHYASLRIL